MYVLVSRKHKRESHWKIDRILETNMLSIYEVLSVKIGADSIYIIIQHKIVTLPKYGLDALNIRRPQSTDILRYK